MLFNYMFGLEWLKWRVHLRRATRECSRFKVQGARVKVSAVSIKVFHYELIASLELWEVSVNKSKLDTIHKKKNIHYYSAPRRLSLS